MTIQLRLEAFPYKHHRGHYQRWLGWKCSRSGMPYWRLNHCILRSHGISDICRRLLDTCRSDRLLCWIRLTVFDHGSCLQWSFGHLCMLRRLTCWDCSSCVCFNSQQRNQTNSYRRIQIFITNLNPRTLIVWLLVSTFRQMIFTGDRLWCICCSCISRRVSCKTAAGEQQERKYSYL